LKFQSPSKTIKETEFFEKLGLSREGFIDLPGELQTFKHLLGPVLNKTAVSFDELAAFVPDFLVRLTYFLIGAASPLPGFVCHLAAGVLKRHPGSMPGLQQVLLNFVPRLLTGLGRHQQSHPGSYQTSQQDSSE
jgi:hypothetical protein